MNIDFFNNKVIIKIQEIVEDLDLNLSGFNVLTEVGSDMYRYTPIIAQIAGANKVMSWTRDSIHGKAKKIINDCKKIESQIIGYNNKIDFFEGELNIKHLSSADIITNSGFLRPLDSSKLKYVKKDVVIPLMYEKWELRHSDIDINYCKKKNIKVSATNENYHKIQVFEYVGPLALKMCFEAGYEVFNNEIIVWSDDNFGTNIMKTFKLLKPKKLIQTTNFSELINNIQDIDFIFIADYDEQRFYNENDFFDLKKIKSKNKKVGIIHLYGGIDYMKIKKLSIPCYPPKSGLPSNMSFQLNHIGINPFVKLIAAGLKVGEHMLKGNYNNELIQPILK